MSLHVLQRKCESLVAILRRYDADAADRFDDALEGSWHDHASMAELHDDLREIVAEEVRWAR